MKLQYTAHKVPGVFIGPLFDRVGSTWQAHHVTNPAAFRLTGERRVLLGYRAGGDRDHYMVGQIDVYSSSLGLAVLSEDGSQLVCRFPYPILWVTRNAALPQAPEEAPAYLALHENEITVMHDFRIYEHAGCVYVNYHDGTIHTAFDRLCRMPAALFRQKVDEGIEMTMRGVQRDEWQALWRLSDWEALGADEEHHLFPGQGNVYPTKTDVTFFRTDAGVQMLRRPIPDISRLPAPDLVGYRTRDGFDEMGVIERCVRPGRWDNSHIGPNAMSTPAHIGDLPVYIDIWHGVHNGAIGLENKPFEWDMYYSPFFSIRDAASGDLLYWGEDPIIDPDDDVWSEYTREGRWIQALAHTYILFVGGQVAMRPGQNGEDDPFTFYAGAGDTAIVRGEFTIRSLTPPAVLADILTRRAHRACPCPVAACSCALPGDPAGWQWTVANDGNGRCLSIKRSLHCPTGTEEALHPIWTRPGYFDADCVTFDGNTCLTEHGYAVIYRGARWEQDEDGRACTRVQFGVLLMDAENPERVLYRSLQPWGEAHLLPGFVSGQQIPCPNDVDAAMASVPEATLREIRHIKALILAGRHWRSHHTQWLEDRAAKK